MLSCKGQVNTLKKKRKKKKKKKKIIIIIIIMKILFFYFYLPLQDIVYRHRIPESHLYTVIGRQ